MKIVDERETQKNNKKTNKDRKDQGGKETIVKRPELNDFVAGSIILKQRELYEPKHVVVECRCLKI